VVLADVQISSANREPFLSYRNGTITRARRIMIQVSWIAIIVATGISPANATTCEEFMARFKEGAARYKMPAPQFAPRHVNIGHVEKQYIITTLNDVHSMVSCRHGTVESFSVTANNLNVRPTDHVATLAAIGLFSDGRTWRDAYDIEDRLKDRVINPELQLVRHTTGKTQFSIIVSRGGVVYFGSDNRSSGRRNR
jgi:hypothetical protein